MRRIILLGLLLLGGCISSDCPGPQNWGSDGRRSPHRQTDDPICIYAGWRVDGVESGCGWSSDSKYEYGR